LRLANGRLPWPWIDPDKALPWVEERIRLALAESQVAAIRLALISKVLVITGGPGVGKTTIVNAILRVLAAKGINLLLCAPTGRAAKRMTEATGFEAKTIHRLLEVDPKGGGFKRADDNPLDCELVVDETLVIPVMTQHYAMLQRNLLYIGVTRGKRLVVLVGQKKAIAIAVRNVSGRQRWSKLNEWLRSDALSRSIQL
jgi:exodeoxyribonuclease V alpha subunit